MAPSDGGSLQDFKARLPLIEIVGRVVKLQRKGRDYWGLCPFHNEKSPSFKVDDGPGGAYHCFGCGAHGNGIDFLMETEGLTFVEAVRRAAELTGLPAPAMGRGDNPAVQVERKGLIEANEAAAAWYGLQLLADGGRKARGYLRDRGLRGSSLQRFALGYAPAHGDPLKKHLLDQGFSEAGLIEAGLLGKSDDSRPAYDRFRDRLMFPIRDRRGKVVGFGGRALGEAKAKYLNTSETPVFNKGHLLYNLDLAARPARAAGELLVVEGYMDVIALAEAGFAAAVAPLGTAVSETQLQSLWQLVDEPIFCFDGDAAGLSAADRTAERALPLLTAGKSLRFVLLPEGDDPDSYVRKAGAEAMRGQIARAMPLIDLLWHRALAKHRLDTPERRAGLERSLRKTAEQVGDPAVKRAYVDELVFQRLRSHLRSLKRARDAGRPAPTTAMPMGLPSPRGSLSERALLAPILATPAMLQQLEDEFVALELADRDLLGLREAVLDWYAQAERLDRSSLFAHLRSSGWIDTAELCVASIRHDNRPTDDGSRDPIEAWRGMCARHFARSARVRAKQALAEALLSGADEREVRARLAAQDMTINKRDR